MEVQKHSIPILFRVSPHLNQELRELAQREERSVAAQLRRLIRDAVEKKEERPETKQSST